MNEIKKDCILISSHLDNFYKEQVALSLLDFLGDKNLPIIFVGNYVIPPSIQKKSNWSLYVKENPTTLFKRVMVSNGKTAIDYGYAHLHQIGKGFLLAKSLGFNYVHHFNYDVVFKEEEFNKLIQKGKDNNPIVYEWGEFGLATNVFSIKVQDYLDSVEQNLDFYKNENPPNITNGWFCEVFFKWALKYNNINFSITNNIGYQSIVNSWE